MSQLGCGNGGKGSPSHLLAQSDSLHENSPPKCRESAEMDRNLTCQIGLLPNWSIQWISGFFTKLLCLSSNGSPRASYWGLHLLQLPRVSITYQLLSGNAEEHIMSCCQICTAIYFSLFHFWDSFLWSHVSRIGLQQLASQNVFTQCQHFYIGCWK